MTDATFMCRIFKLKISTRDRNPLHHTDVSPYYADCLISKFSPQQVMHIQLIDLRSKYEVIFSQSTCTNKNDVKSTSLMYSKLVPEKENKRKYYV